MITSLLIGERATLDGVVVERESLLGFRVGEQRGLSAEEAKKVFGEAASPYFRKVAEAGQQRIPRILVATCATTSPVPVIANRTGTGVSDGERTHETLAPGPEAEARIAELKLRHGGAVVVRGRARAKRSKWTGARTWLVVSYPKENG